MYDAPLPDFCVISIAEVDIWAGGYYVVSYGEGKLVLKVRPAPP